MMALYVYDKDWRALRPTARDLLESVAGQLHALHSVVKKRVRLRTTLITCSCGQRFSVPNEDSGEALRNVAQ